MTSKTKRSYPAEDPFSRRSVTVDEAAAIMMGYLDGPNVFYYQEGATDEEVEYIRNIAYDLAQDWADEREELEEKLHFAIRKGRPKKELDDIRGRLAQVNLEAGKAQRWMCEIEDELSKGESSALRLDKKLSNDHVSFITIWRLHEWAKAKGYQIHLKGWPIAGDDAQEMPDPTALGSGSGAEQETTKKRIPKQTAQKEAILGALKDLGHDPKSLPKRSPGKPWVKTAVRERLRTNPLFASQRAFDKAWEALRGEKELVEGTEPYSP